MDRRSFFAALTAIGDVTVLPKTKRKPPLGTMDNPAYRKIRLNDPRRPVSAYLGKNEIHI